ncbi:hypothetical protein TNCV_3814371 [Trichonephila clavipes]|nr:hypothetical protein TNCV_3814371 [Trichonephila clavipes]
MAPQGNTQRIGDLGIVEALENLSPWHGIGVRHVSSLKDTFQRLKKCLTAGFELLRQLSEFEKDYIIGMKEAGSANRRITRHMGRRIRPFEDTGKNGWAVANFGVMMVAVDLGQHQIGKTD